MQLNSFKSLIIVSLFIPLFSCSDPENPWGVPENATGMIKVSSEHGKFDKLSSTDTIDSVFFDSTKNPITISVTHYLPQYIDSAILYLCTSENNCEKIAYTHVKDTLKMDLSDEDTVIIDSVALKTIFTKKKVFHRSGLMYIRLAIFTKFNTTVYSEKIFLYLYCSPVPIKTLFKDSSVVISPVLNDTVRNYTAKVKNNQNVVTFHPTTSNPLAQISINDIVLSAITSSLSCTLLVGNNNFTFYTTADDGKTKDSLKLTINRAAGDEATLKLLGVPGLKFDPAFEPLKTVYTVTVGNNTRNISVIAIPSQPTARMYLDTLPLKPGIISDPIALRVGENRIRINVTAEDNIAKKSYDLFVTRTLSSISTLDHLQPSSGELSPTFDADIMDYTVNVEHRIDSISFDVLKSDSNATVKINGKDSSKIALKSYDNTLINIVVTAEDGTKKTYKVTVWREGSEDATLRGIETSVGNFFPGVFSSDTLNYVLRVKSTDSVISIRPTKSYSGANVTINGTSVDNDRWSNPCIFPQGISDKHIEIRVDSENTKKTKMYKIIVSRAYTLTLGTEGNGSIKPSVAIDAFHGIPLSIEAMPAEGNFFKKWSMESGMAVIEMPTLDSTTVIVKDNSVVRAIFALKTYNVNIRNSEHGTIQGPATIRHGEVDTIFANPDSGYSFVAWVTDSGIVNYTDSLNDTTQVTLEDGNVRISALFKIKTYQLTLAKEGSGLVSGPSTLTHGTVDIIRAQADTGYLFTTWKVTTGTAIIGSTTDALTTIALKSGNATVTSVFESKSFQLKIDTVNHGSVTGAGTVRYGVPQAITATPRTHYHFVKWSIVSGQAIIQDSTADSTTVVLQNSNATIAALFELDTYQLTINTEGEGVVSGAGVVAHGHTDTIKAQPANGFSFQNWEIISGNPVIFDTNKAITTIILEKGNATIQAIFKRKEYRLTLTQKDSGSILCDNKMPTTGTTLIVQHGISYPLIANPDTGCHIKCWTVDSGAAIFESPNSRTTMVRLENGDAKISGDFTINWYHLKLTHLGNGTAQGVRTSLRSDTIDDGFVDSVKHGDTLNIFSVPDISSNFVKWRVIEGTVEIGDSIYSNSNIILRNGDVTICAIFELKQFTLTYESVTNGSIRGKTIFKYGVPDTIIATPDSGYRLASWVSKSATVTKPNADTSTIVLNSNANVIAFFTINRYTLIVNYEGNGTTNVLRVDTLTHKSFQNIRATPATGWHFVRWRVDSGFVELGREDSLSTTARLTRGNVHITAVFAINKYRLNRLINGPGKPANILIPDSVEHEVTYEISATPGTGVNFVKWSARNRIAITDSTAASTTIRVTGPNDTLKVDFKYLTCTLSIASDTVYGRVSGPKVLDYGQPYTIKAVPRLPSYEFYMWKVTSGAPMILNDRSDSTQIRLVGNATIEATFKRKIYNLTVTIEVPNSGTVIVPDSVYYDSDTIIVAIPSKGYHFKGWRILSGSPGVIIRDSLNDTTRINMKSYGQIMPIFELNRYILSVSLNDTLYGTVTPKKDTLGHNIPEPIRATPNTGYLFQKWQIDSGVVSFYNKDSTNPDVIINMTDGNAKLKAVFIPRRYHLSVFSDSLEMGTVIDTSIMVSHNEPYRIIAIPTDTCRLRRWSVDSGTAEIAYTTKDTTTVTLTNGNAIIKASFELKKYKIIYALDSYGRYLEAPDSASHGISTSITSMANQGYRFDRWFGRGTGSITFTDSSNSTTTFKLRNGDIEIVAVFAKNN